MAKALKTICLEILMYLTIITMTGHVLAHFFDYYVTRNELSQMKITLNSLKITLNSMGKGYNRLNDEFIEIIKEGSNMPESKQKYDYKAKEHDMKGIRKEFDLILNNIKQKDSVTTIEEYNNLKGEPNLGNISPIRRKTYLKEKHTQSGITSIGKDNILRDRTTSGGFSPIGRNQIKGNKISSNINHSRRSDFCEVVGKSNLRCFCKQPPSYYECYDDENKSSYIELP